MMGAFVAYFLLNKWGVGYWWALAIVPLWPGRLRRRDRAADALAALQAGPPLRLLLTFGLAPHHRGHLPPGVRLVGPAVPDPEGAAGGSNLGFMFLPNYRAWVIVSSLDDLHRHLVPDRAHQAGRLPARRDREPGDGAGFGVNVPRMITLTYGFGVALAALAGVFAAPIYQVAPQMGSSLIIVVFAVVVIGGMGSIMGSIITGFGLGIVEGLTKVFYPEASNTVIFVIMAIVLMIRPQGLFGQR
jgi:branched-chain amino acid transport system permease protein